MMTLIRQRGCAPKTFIRMACAVTIGLAGFAMTASPASAFTPGAGSSLRQQLKPNNQLTEVVVIVRRGGVARRTIVVGRRRGAIGFVAAATAIAWAGEPPAPGYCWYYTDPDRTQGFWDVCPQ
jgi:hypothetical protein